MECYSEVAIYAKEIAEKRLLKSDYAGAKEMALLAKKLFPLYNNSQLLAVCEVHCSSQLMANGLYDWYKIIQVEPMCDEITIQKQCHKLAALLNPEKNKMPGAVAAFKLVGEANNILSDSAKRKVYDLKRKHLVRSPSPLKSTETNAPHNSCSNLNRENKWRSQQQPQQQPHQGFTFCPECPGCNNCSRIFTANAPPHLNPGNQPQQFTGHQQPQRSDSYRFTYVRRVRGTTSTFTAALPHNPRNPPQQFTGQQQPQWSDSYRGNAEGTDGGNHAAGVSRLLRRSSLNKPDVKYIGISVSNPSKKARREVRGARNGDSAGTTSRNLRRSSLYNPYVKYNGTCVLSPSKKPNGEAEILYDYPDPEFHKFDMCRTGNKFEQGDIWALYSDLDMFPKYYGLICKVEHEPFQVHINWLKAFPKSDVERAGLGENLPISCGKFRVTTQSTTYDKPDYFSHMVSVRHHNRGNYYEILPEVGEVWAIYKNWSAGWMPCDFKTNKFDIVEIIEIGELSTIVCLLRQVPEYTSVFMPEKVDGTGSGTWKVPVSAYILFSHKIPAIRLTNECGGKLEGFWELDPASVP
ncbi:hypothetical protein LUZ61_008663 [Rhynchospora tenuis]|uniref:J domain-containing protein n=1 Tax=Rhynchospora tenuis TaxID=198213 RepID=A0AAD5ZVY8_9POAL|nr:hypothetical protein LUZ61_008663 [Rhynchospora tenuis]